MPHGSILGENKTQLHIISAVLYMPHDSILGENKFQPRISAGQTKMVFLRSSGIRHRKWTLLPDFTVGILSQCIIRVTSILNGTSLNSPHRLLRILLLLL